MNVVVLRFRRETLGWNVVGSSRESGVLQHFKFIGALRHVGICWAKTSCVDQHSGGCYYHGPCATVFARQ